MDLKDATLEDLKTCRPDLCELLRQEMKNKPKEKPTRGPGRPRKNIKLEEEEDEAPVNPPRNLEIGQIVLWKPTKEKGTILRLEPFGDRVLCLRRVIVELPDGTQATWYDNPKLLFEV